MDIVANWPGSTHDVTIFNSSRLKARFENGEFNNGILLGKHYNIFNVQVHAVPNGNKQNSKERKCNKK